MMQNIFTNVTELLLLLFIIITFLQSAIDKIMDWKGNLSWLTAHFSKTLFKNIVPLLLGVILLTEIIAGILCLIGVYQFFMYGESFAALAGAIVSCVALLMLLLGQRIAKDYDGARTIAIYFVPTILLVYLLNS